ncbi:MULTISPECIES: hypothetical protein [Burkholderia]|nr:MULTISPECIES: hypothetical protein [Burkholderia]
MTTQTIRMSRRGFVRAAARPCRIDDVSRIGFGHSEQAGRTGFARRMPWARAAIARSPRRDMKCARARCALHAATAARPAATA